MILIARKGVSEEIGMSHTIPWRMELVLYARRMPFHEFQALFKCSSLARVFPSFLPFEKGQLC